MNANIENRVKALEAKAQPVVRIVFLRGTDDVAGRAKAEALRAQGVPTRFVIFRRLSDCP